MIIAYNIDDPDQMGIVHELGPRSRTKCGINIDHKWVFMKPLGKTKVTCPKCNPMVRPSLFPQNSEKAR